MNWSQYAVVITSLFAIMNPIGAAPIFLELTEGQSVAEHRKTALTAAMAVAAILIVSAWTGTYVLQFFGISLAAFRVGGGILLLLMAIDMLNARPSRTRRTEEEKSEAQEQESVAVVPLAIPLLAGPGAISTVILNAHTLAALPQRLILSAIIIGVSATIWLALTLAIPISRVLGKTGNNILVRIMGLILAAIAVEFIITGSKAIWG